MSYLVVKGFWIGWWSRFPGAVNLLALARFGELHGQQMVILMCDAEEMGNTLTVPSMPWRMS